MVISFNPPKEYNEIGIIPILQTWDQRTAVVLVSCLLFQPQAHPVIVYTLCNLCSAGTLQTTWPRTLNQLVSYEVLQTEARKWRKWTKQRDQNFFLLPCSSSVTPIAAVVSHLHLLLVLPHPVLSQLLKGIRNRKAEISPQKPEHRPCRTAPLSTSILAVLCLCSLSLGRLLFSSSYCLWFYLYVPVSSSSFQHIYTQFSVVNPSVWST